MTLTGANAALGVNGRGGVLLAEELKEEILGPLETEIELVIFDDMGNPGRIQNLVQMAEEMGIRFFLGPLTSNMSENLLASIEDRDMLVLSPTISSPLVSEKDDRFLRIIESSKVHGQVLAQRALDDGFDRVAIVYDHRNQAYTSGVLQGIESTGIGVVLQDGLYSDVQDYAALADKIKRSGTMAVIFATASLPAAAIAQQLRNQGASLALYGSKWTATSDIIERGGRALEGCIFYGNYYSQENTQNYDTFAAAYKAAYGKDPDFVAESSFEATLILCEALEAVGEGNAQMVKDYILDKGDFFILNSPISLDDYGDAQRYYSLLQIQEGDFVPIYP
jgi:branched-chain amino acid transport system substrate-binding protein